MFYLKAVRDVLLVLGALFATIALAGGIMYGLDQGTNFTQIFPPAWAVTVRNVWFQLFVFGTCLLCFVIGVCGICYGIARCLGGCCESCCAAPSYRYDTYVYHTPCPPWWWWWWWTPPRIGPARGCDCDCGSCSGSSCSSSDCNCSGGGNCDGDAGKGLVIVLAVIVVVIILIGFFVGTALLVYICHRLVRNHLRLLEKEIQAQGLEVVDRAAEPEVGPDEVVDTALLTEPTAPLMEDFVEPRYSKQQC